MAWWNDYDRGEYGRWSTRYDTMYWNNPGGRSFGYGGYGVGAHGGGYGGYGARDYGRYGEDYTPRVAPAESPAYGRQADRLVRRNAYDAGYALQPRTGRMEGGWNRSPRGDRDDWNARGGFGRAGRHRGYGADYGGFGGRGRTGYDRGYASYDRGYRW